ncbi:MAG: hypothetical protein ACJAXS_001253 [Colwellia sp.]|jgi:hypothetical protein
MKNVLKKQLTLATILSLSTITSVFAEVKETIEKSFTVSAQANLRLTNVNGGVEIKGWDKSEIKITAIITEKNQEDRERINIEFSKRSSDVNVETHYIK